MVTKRMGSLRYKEHVIVVISQIVKPFPSLQTRSQSQLRENGKKWWLMRLVCLDDETSGLTRILHFDPKSFRFPEEGQLPSLAPEGIVTLSSYLLEELLLRE